MKWISNTTAMSQDFWLKETSYGLAGLIRFGPVQGNPEYRVYPPLKGYGVYIIEDEDKEQEGYERVMEKSQPLKGFSELEIQRKQQIDTMVLNSYPQFKDIIKNKAKLLEEHAAKLLEDGSIPKIE